MPIVPINSLPENAVTVIRGASKTLELVVKDTDGNPADLTGARVVLTVKENIGDLNPVVQKDSNDPSQAEITVPRAGTARIYLVPGDTQNLFTKQYVFDVWVVLGSGKRYPVVQPSIFEVLAGVTLLAL